MPTINLRTFLSNDLRDSTGLVDKYAVYGKGGGYQYWHSSDSAIVDLTVGGQAYDAVVGACNSVLKSDERISNKNVVQRFAAWKVKQDVEWHQPPVGLLVGPKGILRVKVTPNAAYLQKGKLTLVVLWPYERYPLPAKLAKIGVNAMRKAFAGTPYEDSEFCIHDVSRDHGYTRRFVTGSVPKGADKQLAFMLAQHEAAYEVTHDAA